MKQRKLLLVSCLPLIVLVIGGLVWGFGARGTSKPVTGRVEIVTRGEVAIRVTETGLLEPLKKVEVKSKVAGKIERLFVSEGSRVAAGQLLVLVDPTEINSQVAQMQAQLDGARARLRQAQRGVGFQSEQTVTGVQQAEEALQSALARLQVARDEYAAQPARTRSDLAQAQAGLEATRNSLALLKEATQPQAVVQARTNLDEAEAALVEARSQVERNEKLLAKGFVAQQAVDSARTALASASARRDQAKARLDLLGNQSLLEIAEAENRVAQARATLDRARADRSLQTRRQELLSAEAAVRQARSVLRAARANTQQDRMRGDEVEQARAQVTQLENSLREVAVRQTDTRILAPMSGTVTHRYIEEGELVTSGVSAFSSGQPVLQIADLSRMLVNLNVNEVDVQRIRPGLPAEVAVDGVRGVRFAARVRKVAPAAAGGGAAAAGGRGGGQGVLGGGGGGVIRFPVEVAVSRADARLRPGMSARCTVVIARRANVLRLPETCVTGDGDKGTVQVVTSEIQNGKTVEVVEPRQIVAGLRGGGQVEIVSGLKEGDRVRPGKYSGPPRKGFGAGIFGE